MAPVKLATALWNHLLQHKTLPDFPKTETCDLIIVTRAVDPVLFSPLLHGRKTPHMVFLGNHSHLNVLSSNNFETSCPKVKRKLFFSLFFKESKSPSFLTVVVSSGSSGHTRMDVQCYDTRSAGIGWYQVHLRGRFRAGPMLSQTFGFAPQGFCNV